MARFAQLALFAGAALAAAHTPQKALPNAPNGYTPTAEDCPSTPPTVRLAKGLSDNESQWVQTRRNVTLPAMTELLGSLNISGFDAAGYLKNQSSVLSNIPNIAIAVSGGGNRALLTGAGALKAFDSRETTTTGGLGGLLQSATYVAGLSGGGWLVGSVYVNNFTTISDLQSSTGLLWNLTDTVFTGPDTSVEGEFAYYDTLGTEVMGKHNAGYDISITDFWGRTLSFQFFNATDGGPSFTWSSIRDQPGFSTGQIPFPLVVADNRVNNQTAFPSMNTTIYEFNPFEMGTWDPTTYGFVDLQYLGSNFSNGMIPAGQQCVRGYDNAGFVIGTTSSIFTSLASEFISTQVPQAVQGALGNVIQETKEDEGFVAYYEPNPFKDWNPTGQSEDSDTDTLYLVDGGTDGENLPLWPLVQPARSVDVIVAIDASNDINGYPNGSALVQTYARSMNPTIANGTTFPTVPDQNSFVNLGLNMRPTFFGCNETTSPLLVYIPNAPYTSYPNHSTFQLSYTYADRDALIANAELVATQGNGTGNTEFKACLGCAILSRSFSRSQTQVPAACQTCFAAYCWNGQTNSTEPSSTYLPNLIGASPNGFGLNVSGSETGQNGSAGGTVSVNSTSSTTPTGAASGSRYGATAGTAMIAAVMLAILL